MLFCNLTPLDGRFVNAIVFCRKSELPLYTFNIQFMYNNLIFFVFTMKQIASIFCNFSFVRQYIRMFTYLCLELFLI